MLAAVIILVLRGQPGGRGKAAEIYHFMALHNPVRGRAEGGAER